MKIKNKIKIEGIFDGCKYVFSFPDISKWNSILEHNIFIISSNDINKSNISKESNEISTKSSSFKTNSSNTLEQFEGFEDNIEFEEKDYLNEYYRNFYNI